MNVTRIYGLLVLAATMALAACGGGGAPTTATPGAGSVTETRRLNASTHAA